MALRLLTLLLLINLSLPAQTQVSLTNEFDVNQAANNTFLPVEQAYSLFSSTDDKHKLNLLFRATAGYFLYRHGFAIEWLESGSTRKAGFTIADGIKKEDEIFGEVETYHQQAELSADLPKHTSWLKVSSQGCADAGLCYPPYHLYYLYDADNNALLEKTATEYSVASQSNAVHNPTAPGYHPISLLWALIAAFIGGLILNLMPCVLPILSIKLFQLAQQDRSSAKQQGLAYLLGVMFSFVAIAVVLIALRNTGHGIGWGFQLQQPWFIALLVYLFLVLGLSMASFIDLGQRFMGAGDTLTQGNNLKSAFFTGVLAVIVASPCTAPFMGTALGYALTQSNAVALLIFASLGLGMALPLTVISWIPKAQRLLPKPGSWMQSLKEFFAFPLFITAIWLLWVLNNQTHSNAAAIVLLGCVAISFALWSFKKNNPIVKAFGLAALIIALLLPFSHQLNTREKIKPLNDGHIAYSAATLAKLRSNGHAVFIDLTADWCITCLANEKVTLKTKRIQQAFKKAHITYMVGDWTNYNPEITALLSKYQRSGIPLYLLFPTTANAPAIILPQILTDRIILDAIANAQ